jgi:hypothetical protein
VKRRQKVSSKVKVNAYEVLCRAVEQGLIYGWSRAHKHTDTPDEEAIKLAMYEAITNEICEVFVFDGDA